jgi:UDP-glucose 4-epimerase
VKVFITGGTGAIDAHVSLAVANAGHEAIVLSRDPEKYSDFVKLHDNLSLVGGHITEYDKMEKYVKGMDAVIHIALGWGLTPVKMLTNDTTATVNLLELSERAGVKKFIYTSSTAAMGHNRQNMDEGFSNLPLDLYGATKSATEAYVLGFSKYYEDAGGNVSMKRNVIRPGYTYSTPLYQGGTTQLDSRFRDIASAAKKGETIKLIKNDGTQFLSAHEIAKVYLAILESDKNEEVYLSLHNEFHTWEYIAKMALEECPDSKAAIELIDKNYGDTPMLYNVDKMKRDFGLSFDGTDELRKHVRWSLSQI